MDRHTNIFYSYDVVLNITVTNIKCGFMRRTIEMEDKTIVKSAKTGCGSDVVQVSMCWNESIIKAGDVNTN